MKKVKQIKKALPLLLVMVMFVTATLPVYAAGTVSYEYNWEGQKEVAYEGITVTDTAGNELTLKTEDGTTNNYVLLTNTSGAAANVQADISGIDPTQDIVIEVSLKREGNMPPMEIKLSGMDAEGKNSNALIFLEMSNTVRNINKSSTQYNGYLNGNGWKNIGLILNTTKKTVALYMYDAESQDYVYKQDIGTCNAEFAALTKLVVGCRETSTQKERKCGIDDIRVYNGSEFIAKAEPTKYNVTITTQETGKDDAIDTYENGATSGTDYTYTLPIATGYEYSVSAVTIGGTAYIGYTVSEGKLTVPGAAVTGDVAITLVKTATQSVASIGDVNYTTLEAAVEAAANIAAANTNATVTVTLKADATLPSNYDQAITYDLNGHTLTVTTVTDEKFTGVNAKVMDSSNGNNGLLKILQDKLVFDKENDNGGYIPVWDSTSEGYRFSSVTISDINYDSTEALVFAMRPAFASSDIEKLVAAGHETSKVRVGVRITWPGSDKPYDLPLSDDWLFTMYGGETAKGVKLTISGGETITEFTATTIVWSEQCPYVVITGETHEYSAKVE